MKDWIKKLFGIGDTDGGPKWGPIIGTGGLALIGGLLGSSFGKGGLVSTIIGGVAGAGAGVFLNGPLQRLWSWLMHDVLKMPVDTHLQEERQPDPQSVQYQQLNIHIPGQGNQQHPVIVPSMPHFQQLQNLQQYEQHFVALQTQGATLAQRVRNMREQVQNAPNAAARLALLEQFMGAQGDISQLLANAQLWNQRAGEWNATVKPQILASFNQAFTAVGLPDVQASYVPTAPTMAIISMANDDELRRDIANLLVPAGQRVQWLQNHTRIQDVLLYAERNLDTEIAALDPSGNGANRLQWSQLRVTNFLGTSCNNVGRSLANIWCGVGEVLATPFSSTSLDQRLQNIETNPWAAGVNDSATAVRILMQQPNWRTQMGLIETHMNNAMRELGLSQSQINNRMHVDNNVISDPEKRRAIVQWRSLQRYLDLVRLRTRVTSVRNALLEQVEQFATQVVAQQFPQYLGEVHTLHMNAARFEIFRQHNVLITQQGQLNADAQQGGQPVPANQRAFLLVQDRRNGANTVQRWMGEISGHTFTLRAVANGENGAAISIGQPVTINLLTGQGMAQALQQIGQTPGLQAQAPVQQPAVAQTAPVIAPGTLQAQAPLPTQTPLQTQLESGAPAPTLPDNSLASLLRGFNGPALQAANVLSTPAGGFTALTGMGAASLDPSILAAA